LTPETDIGCESVECFLFIFPFFFGFSLTNRPRLWSISFNVSKATNHAGILPVTFKPVYQRFVSNWRIALTACICTQKVQKNSLQTV